MLNKINLFCLIRIIVLALIVFPCPNVIAEMSIVKNYEDLNILHFKTGKIVPLHDLDIDIDDIKLVTINFQNINNVDASLLKSYNKNLYQSDKMTKTNYTVSGGFGINHSAIDMDNDYKDLEDFDLDAGKIASLAGQNINPADLKVATIQLQNLQDIDISLLTTEGKEVQQTAVLAADSMFFLIGALGSGAITAIVATPITIIPMFIGAIVGGISGAIAGGVAGVLSGFPASGIFLPLYGLTDLVTLPLYIIVNGVTGAVIGGLSLGTAGAVTPIAAAATTGGIAGGLALTGMESFISAVFGGSPFASIGDLISGSVADAASMF